VCIPIGVVVAVERVGRASEPIVHLPHLLAAVRSLRPCLRE
jgi:hypothetical protein